jgi:hypothetical protein
MANQSETPPVETKVKVSRPADERAQAVAAGQFVAGVPANPSSPADRSAPHQARAPPDRGPYLPARKVWQRYGVTDRTLDRWIEDPKVEFPKPLVINGRRYFSDPELVVWERKRAGKAA